MRLLVLIAASVSVLPLATPARAEPPAKELFGAVTRPADMPSRVLGFYAKGCLAGAEALPVDGPAWQVMRLSRNRAWGHPALINFLEKFAREVPRVNGWPGILVGDIAQPRGGPMKTGHASHQIGLDADVWLTPMPNRPLSRAEREDMAAADMVRDDKLDVSQNWTKGQHALIKAAAQKSQVERIFVNAAIKKALCREATGDRSWLQRVRPMYGHNWHMHIRMACPAGEADCQSQDPVPAGEGCGKELDYWFSDAVLHPRPGGKPKPPMEMSALPNACRAVLNAP
ncbi:penicillin-insensitive murein endopeptidase [Alsobacter metallidurans]|uniref:Penicillin-insensitive murein endopeptidase n=1 Tax=Alsobacter metallidurans TaxID=340221 RepID=A0A917I2S9_9HYPH|nr:penicillin-insensitive murein endopeptidase [Alsobacter metallidurans]GGH07902.1 penicillin-insensitive murein endopeptidase [Alsobacter metallidurans]